jgi:hypothetical protein
MPVEVIRETRPPFEITEPLLPVQRAECLNPPIVEPAGSGSPSPVGENPPPSLKNRRRKLGVLRGFPLCSGAVSGIWGARTHPESREVTSSSQRDPSGHARSGHFVHHRRRSFNLCCFPECSPAQIVDDLASKIVIRQVCRRGERLFESVQIGWSRFASISPGGQDAQSCFDQFLRIHRPSPGIFNILALNVCFCTWAADFGLPLHLVRSSILGTASTERRAVPHNLVAAVPVAVMPLLARLIMVRIIARERIDGLRNKAYCLTCECP